MSKTLKIMMLSCALWLTSAAIAKEPAQESPIKLTSPISTIDSHEGIIADVTIEPNAAMPIHQHPGDEFLYMLSGSVELAMENRAPLTLTAGQAFQIPAGTIHSPKAGPEGARAIVFRVHPEGQPVTVPINE